MREITVKSINRINALGYKAANPRKNLNALAARGLLLVEYMTCGCPHDWVRQYTRKAPTGEEPDRHIPIEPGWPLTLEEAADALRIKRRNARWISRQPVFQRELAEQLQSLRNGMKARALIAQGEILEDKGENTAADRRVRLQASQTILAEESRQSPVSVTVNNNVPLTAGIVIRLPHEVALTPLESHASLSELSEIA